MAVAFDSVSSFTTNSNDWTSTTVSGAGVGIVYVQGETTGDHITAVTWGGVSMTKITASQLPSDRWTSAWSVSNPASAATIHFTGGAFFAGFTLSYTGSASPVDSSNSGTSSSSGTITVATTVVSSNCWTVMLQCDNSGVRTYTTNVGTMRVAADTSGIAISDSNGTVGTGSQSTTLSQTGGTANHTGIAFSIAPRQSLTLTAAQASITLTTFTTGLVLAHHLIASLATVTLTSFATALTPHLLWINSAKNSSVYTDSSKHASSWVDSSKHSTSFTNGTKHSNG